MEQFWALKLIACVDIRVVSIFYSFQSVRVDLGGELEKLTKYSKITEYSKSMSPNFDSLYLWKIAPHPYVSYIFRNVWISSFTLSSLNLYYVVKITHKLRFKKKYRFLQISTILGLIPIVNVVISRFCVFWFNLLYDFI